MHLYIGDMEAYGFFNSLGSIMAIVFSLLWFKAKREAMGLFSGGVISFVSGKNARAGKIVETLLVVSGLLLFAWVSTLAFNFNKPFGELVGTGYNYFGGLLAVPVLVIVLSLVLVVNPLKQLDITTLGLPVCLFFVKIACFCQGCCYGVPWEHGLYNHIHMQKQVPVQLIEALWAVLILVALLVYRKKAKAGTVFPVYMILYSGTRFFSEFLRREQEVLWIFKTYHLLCIAGVLIGLVLFFVIRRYGDRISGVFERIHKRVEGKSFSNGQLTMES